MNASELRIGNLVYVTDNLTNRIFKEITPINITRTTTGKPMKATNKQTAVDWLIEQLEPAIALQSKIIQEYVEQAKAMEKQQIIDAYVKGNKYNGFDLQHAQEQYYNKTYKNDNSHTNPHPASDTNAG